MEYLTVKEAAAKWNISERSVQNYCANSKIPDAKRIGNQWLIPSSVERPFDGRLKTVKGHPEITTYHFPLFVHSSFFSNKTELNSEEIELLEAQILYITGNHCDCILKCRQLQKNTISTSVVFGAHCVIGYAAMLLGLYTDYQNSIHSMEKIIAVESIHKADYSLLLAGLQAHATRNYSVISNIDTDKLSFDALYYYRYLMMMNSLVNLTKENNNTISLYLSFLRELEIKGITPTALCVSFMLSFLFKRLGDFAKQNYYLQKACDIQNKTDYISLFTKYYVIAPKQIDDCLLKYDNDYIINIKKNQNDIMLKWLVIHKLSSGFIPLPEFTPEQNEILILMPGSVSLENIAKIKNIPLEEVEKEVKEILKISGVKSLDKLTEYARKRFNEMPNDN